MFSTTYLINLNHVKMDNPAPSFEEFIDSYVGKKALSEKNVARVARSYARSIILNPDEHKDAVSAVADDFACGVEFAKRVMTEYYGWKFDDDSEKHINE